MKITKSQIRKLIKEELQEEMGSFAMGEKVLEMLDIQFGVREEEAPGFLRMMAARLEGKGPASPDMEEYESDYRDPPRPSLKNGDRKGPTKAQLDMMKDYDI
jgi:hypothetical protein|tara:strand:- start:307 stop:612 length:306 start_codon:yes stop_codon:yes gene_type:complete